MANPSERDELRRAVQEADGAEEMTEAEEHRAIDFLASPA